MIKHSWDLDSMILPDDQARVDLIDFDLVFDPGQRGSGRTHIGHDEAILDRDESTSAGVPGEDWEGDSGDNEHTGTINDDTLRGKEGDDILSGIDGNDILKGGEGHDQLDGGLGVDALDGGDGNDHLNGGIGDSHDTLDGGSGIDWLYGGEGGDILYGGTDKDYLYGEDGNDELEGEDGDDWLHGGNGADSVRGGSGNDLLIGFTGNDLCQGGAGNDNLNGQDGQDSLEGGSGADLFTFAFVQDSLAGAADTIMDFSSGEDDKIDLHNIDANSNMYYNQTFAFIGTGAFTNQAGQLRYQITSDGDALVQGDTNGDGRADLEILLKDTSELKASDFVL
ncbi:calcium-binding protein [Inquilinus sp. CA228]|uniref:calcium-binding protein n=1 Tax=Inquilinus sp. CA228 TaxID=3455609 RepID=UPI003F8D033D